MLTLPGFKRHPISCENNNDDDDDDDDDDDNALAPQSLRQDTRSHVQSNAQSLSAGVVFVVVVIIVVVGVNVVVTQRSSMSFDLNQT